MGYNHYWQRPPDITGQIFSRIAQDFQKCVLALDDAGVPLAGPTGEGLPSIDADLIAFNGLRSCNHPLNEEICIPFPSTDASGIGSSQDAIVGSWLDGVRIRRRTCNGDCSYEPFVFERAVVQGNPSRARPSDVREYCKTGFRPYDLAVQCALLIAKHHLRDEFAVWSSGSDHHWNDARRFCYLRLGYRLDEFKLDEEEADRES